jgi:uncharacterized membrane protein
MTRAAKQDVEMLRALARRRTFREQRGCWAALMRINIWNILAALLALLVITRYLQQDRDTRRIVPMT